MGSNWYVTPPLLMTMLMCAASNGANLTFAEALGISDDPKICPTDAICNKNSWIIGFINSTPYIAICVL